MAAHPNPEVRDLIEAVTRYLVRNPRARDTADGIGQWWIDSTLFDMEVLPAALEWMLEHGWLEAFRSEAMGISYGLTSKGLEDGSRLMIDRRSEEWTTDDD